MYRIIRSYIRNKLRRLRNLLLWTINVAYTSAVFTLVFLLLSRAICQLT
jgi:hypothetical protein